MEKVSASASSTSSTAPNPCMQPTARSTTHETTGLARSPATGFTAPNPCTPPTAAIAAQQASPTRAAPWPSTSGAHASTAHSCVTNGTSAAARVQPALRPRHPCRHLQSFFPSSPFCSALVHPHHRPSSSIQYSPQVNRVRCTMPSISCRCTASSTATSWRCHSQAVTTGHLYNLRIGILVDLEYWASLQNIL
jgi:hypothetical protein